MLIYQVDFGLPKHSEVVKQRGEVKHSEVVKQKGGGELRAYKLKIDVVVVERGGGNHNMVSHPLRGSDQGRGDSWLQWAINLRRTFPPTSSHLKDILIGIYKVLFSASWSSIFETLPEAQRIQGIEVIILIILMTILNLYSLLR